MKVIRILKELGMSRFRTPRRRSTRQRSGFSVSGDKKGSTCKIEATQIIKPENAEIQLEAEIGNISVPQLFTRNLGIIGWGIYIKPTGKIRLKGEFEYTQEDERLREETIFDSLEPNKWNKLGDLTEISVPFEQATLSDLKLSLIIVTDMPITFYANIAGALKYKYLIENDIYDAFKEKISIYIPEILYIDPSDASWEYSVTKGSVSETGTPIVCKSCNRCARLLPIDIENERNTLSYSNHCVTRAPCAHSGFSRYYIESGDHTAFESLIEDGYLISTLGHQLECKVCKKFFVNLPLNPLRDSTQHREDSLRRRALEVLVAELLGNEWIYFNYRLHRGIEFDVMIWEKFERKCFKCQKPLETANDMHLDHTLPLAYLWPLDDNATCLCETCNSSKHDIFPIDFYSEQELIQLTDLTSLTLDLISSRTINKIALDKLIQRIEWFFNDFLSQGDYQKVRQGKKAADLIVKSLNNVIRVSGIDLDLVGLYKEKTGKYPNTVSVRG